MKSDPPPTKCTISSRSPSCKGVCGHCSRGTISRLSSIATRSGFMPRPSTSAPSVSAEWDWVSPLIVRFIRRLDSFADQIHRLLDSLECTRDAACRDSPAAGDADTNGDQASLVGTR